MVFKMSDEKKAPSTEIPEPTFVEPVTKVHSEKSRLTRKHLLIALVSVLVVGLVVTAVLVGIHLVTQSEIEIEKYKFNANGVSQNVSTDNNVVTYHVIKGEVEAWIVQDYDKGLQTTKALIDGQVNCYVTALNRSLGTDASSIPSTPPVGTETAPTQSVLYKVIPEPIADLSFLGVKASKLCANIPTYHAIPDCGTTKNDTGIVANSTSADHRTKRVPRFCATCNRPNCLCACGCCGMVCAWFSSNSCVYYWSGRGWVCTYWIYTGYLYGTFSLQPSCSYYGYYYWP